MGHAKALRWEWQAVWWVQSEGSSQPWELGVGKAKSDGFGSKCIRVWESDLIDHPSQLMVMAAVRRTGGTRQEAVAVVTGDGGGSEHTWSRGQQWKWLGSV